MIGECLKAYRGKFGVGLRELARDLHISAATLSRIESGKPCDQKTLLTLVNWLFTYRGEAPKASIEQRLSAVESEIEHVRTHTLPLG